MIIKTLQFGILYIIGAILVITSIHIVNGAVMQSGSYKIDTDSLNFGGGRSASGSYTNESTEGEIATGNSTSTNYKMSAGFQQYESSVLSVTGAPDVTMSPAIGGITGGSSTGSTFFSVTTDNPAGYTVSIKASNSPAMQAPTDTIANYGASIASPDFNFTAASAAESKFGFTVEGADIVNNFKDNGSACNTGAADTADKCWAGITTSNQTIVNTTSPNYPTGTATTLKFRVEAGSARKQDSGTYVATTTLTILPL